MLHLRAFGSDFHLNLRRNPHLLRKADKFKVLVADVQDGKLNLSEEKGLNVSEIGETYHDLPNEAALTIRKDETTGALEMEGTIGKTLVIKPAPSRIKLSSAPADDEMFLDDEYPTTTTTTTTETSPQQRKNETSWPPTKPTKPWKLKSVAGLKTETGMHIVYRRKQEELLGGSDYLLMEPDQEPTPSSSSSSPRRKREAPTTIWPEVLVIADYDTYNMHGANSINIKRYFVSFWNGVDLRYKLLTGPRVRISLAGIIISKGRDATPYLENNRVKGDAVDSAAALTDMGKYLFRERRLPTYDLAVVVTKLDLCRKQFQPGTCNTGTAGFAYVGGACVVNSRLEKVNSVAIVEDTGGFSGIIVAAHEVGHLLGAVHDGSPAPNYLGGPGAEHCRWEDGYIMSDLRHTDRGFKWSACSIDQFRHFLNSDTATCLHNMPHEDEELPRILPGKMLTLDAQCRKDRGTSACFKDDRVCAQLFCFDSKSGYCVSYRPAAEGSSCGDGQYCINGRCVFEHDNYIPDFTKITETVVNKPDDMHHDSFASMDTAATQARPTFVKPGQRQRTTPNDDWQDNAATDGPTKGTPSPTPPARRSKFQYNTLNRKGARTTAVTKAPPAVATNAVTEAPAAVENFEAKKNDSVCTDVMETIAGGLTCKQFLRNYADRYCSHPYIAANCCASRQLICNANK